MPSRKLFFGKSFTRAYEKFTKNNSLLKKKVDKALDDLEEDAFAIRLETHRLKGKFYGLLSCSCGYDCRIVFTIEKDENGNELIMLHDIGTHDEVY